MPFQALPLGFTLCLHRHGHRVHRGVEPPEQVQYLHQYLVIGPFTSPLDQHLQNCQCRQEDRHQPDQLQRIGFNQLSDDIQCLFFHTPTPYDPGPGNGPHRRSI